MLFQTFKGHIASVLDALETENFLPQGIDRSNVAIEPPRDSSHGDLAVNAAMVLAKAAKKKPRDIADKLVEKLQQLDDVDTAEIAGPGFINLRIHADAWRRELGIIAKMGSDYGRSDVGQGVSVNIEYVSANPTGPMHMGHCRGAVVGDALATLLEFIGHDVIREYYVNDAGAQVDILAQSTHLRYHEVLGIV